MNSNINNINDINDTNDDINIINEIDNNLVDIIKDVNINNNIYNLLKTDKIFDINSLLNTVNTSLGKSIEKNNIIEKKINLIDEKRENINKIFVEKTEKCKQYMASFYVDNKKHKELFKLYTMTVNDILQKNIEYNNNIDNIIEQYMNKYTEYINASHIKSYPTNYLIQLVSNIILINDNKYKMNILFKNALKEEILTQLDEIKSIEHINEKLKLNVTILNQCDEIYNIINNIESDNNINIKEEVIKELGNNI